MINGIWKARAGRIPLSDGVGIIAQTGSNVKQVKTGDRVAGLFFPKWISGRPFGGNKRICKKFAILQL